MTELTQEYLDKSLKKLPTKQDVQDIVDTAVDRGVETLATMVKKGFDHVDDRFDQIEKELDVRERMSLLEKDMGRIKEALHIK